MGVNRERRLMKSILGGANGKLKCKCGKLRFPGRPVCPQCYYGESLDPILQAQVEKRAELIRAGETDPKIVDSMRYKAFNYAKWLVSQDYCGWALAYKRAAKKYQIAEGSIRQIGAQRAAIKTTGRVMEAREVRKCDCGRDYYAKVGSRKSWCNLCDEDFSR
jgi:hypothetical protein